MVNRGTIRADVAGGRIRINTSNGTFLNRGLLTAADGGTLALATLLDNTSGTISGPDGSTVSINGGVVVGGTLAGTIALPATASGTIAGTVNNTGTIAVGTSGASATATLYVGGTLSGGGTVILAEENYSNVQPSSSGLMTIANATVRGQGFVNAYNGVIVNDGTIAADVRDKRLGVNVSGGAFTNNGLMRASGGGMLSLTSKITNTGTVAADEGTVYFTALEVTDDLTVTGTLSGRAAVYRDSARRGSVFQTPGSRLTLVRANNTAESIATLRASVTAGYAGDFSEGGLRGAARMAGLGLGYGDNAAAVTVMYTLYGDADLNGQVNFADFVALQSSFGAAGTTFGQGDFDYNGVVNFADFVKLQTNFGRALPGLRAEFSPAEYLSVMGITNANQVPEPATLAVLGLSVAGLMRRRRA